MSLLLKLIIGFSLSFGLVYVIMKPFIYALKVKNINQEVSQYALDEYKAKAKTPIMGGLLFVIIPLIVYIVFNFKSLNDPAILLVLCSYGLYCLVGFLDDILIILRKDNDGLSPKTKLIMEFIFAIALFIVFNNVLSYNIYFPFIKKQIDLSPIVYLVIIILMYLGEANAVNFTDGMDGLCAGVSLIGLLGFCVLTYLSNQFNVLIFIICVCGGLIAYLFYNHFPAKIFMGDSGSLALGGLFASLGLITNKEIALLVIGGVFLIEMFCVCLQLSCVKLFKRRIFSYTPIHYAFVLKGNKETKVVKGFYIAAIILTIIGVFIGLN